jgi:hypothetical protein
MLPKLARDGYRAMLGLEAYLDQCGLEVALAPHGWAVRG